MFRVSGVVFLLCFVTMVTAEVGHSNADDWSYRWYEGEPFIFTYQPGDGEIDTSRFVVWETPKGVILEHNATSGLYLVRDSAGIGNAQLNITEVTPQTRGVYICYVYIGSDKWPVERKLYGINLSGKKYRHGLDQYRKQLIVAAISSTGFLTIAMAVVTTHFCSYEFRTEKHAHHLRKMMERTRVEARERQLSQSPTKTGGIDVTFAYENQAMDGVNTKM